MNDMFSFDTIQLIVMLTFAGISVFIIVYKRILASQLKRGAVKGLRLIEATTGSVIVNFRKENRSWKLNLDSLASIDEKIDEETGKASREAVLANHDLVFMLGCFLGDCLRYSIGARWNVERKDETPVTMTLKTNEIVMPFDKIRKRIANGPSDSISDYGRILKNGTRRS